MIIVAVGLAAIRPLKRQLRNTKTGDHFGCSGFGRYQAVETHRPARKLYTTLPVAVGLAAIRPLKRFAVTPVLPRFPGCSGFGRYQAVETRARIASRTSGMDVAVGLAAIRPLKRFCRNSGSLGRCRLQWVWPLSGR